MADYPLVTGFKGVPVEIIEGNVAAGWQVQGDMLVQWGYVETEASGYGSVTYSQPYAPGIQPSVQLTALLFNFGLGLEAHVSDSQPDSFDWYSGVSGVRESVGAFFIAVGEAPASLKKPKIVQTAGGTDISEFHDPAGLASWRIIGSTLECWGRSSMSGNATTITYPRTFARRANVQVSVDNDAPAQLWQVQVVQYTSGTEVNQVDVVGRRVSGTDAAEGANVPFYWHAIGPVAP